MSMRALVLASLAIAALCLAAQALVAGPLLPPPGPVAPTPGPEPRTPINATNTPGDADSLFKITQPGSYYLTGNITGVIGKHGIEIEANGVTLDLNGFDLVGVPAMGLFHGVAVTSLTPNLRNTSVINGSVRNWGHFGVDLGLAFNCRIDGIRASGNAFSGISIGFGSTATNCSVLQNGGHGIGAAQGSVVTNCTSYDNTLDGINASLGCVVSDCSVYTNNRNGINVANGSAVLNCTANSNSQIGIVASDECSVTNCTVTRSGFDGIRVSSNSRVIENTCADSGQSGLFSGIFANGDRNRIEGNHVTNTFTQDDAGISVAANKVGNLILRNYASGSGAINYSFPASGNFVGTIVGTSAAMNAAVNANVNISN